MTLPSTSARRAAATVVPATDGPAIPRTAYQRLVDFLVVRIDHGPADAIICFGSRDLAVPQAAAALFHHGAAPIVLTTGGVAFDGQRLEADVFADHLQRAGVPPERIVRERRSRHTGENVTFGMAALTKAIGPVRSLIAVCWPAATRRCLLTLARHHPTVAVSTSPALTGVAHRRAADGHGVAATLAEFDRLTSYAAQGFIAEAPIPPLVQRAAAQVRRALQTADGPIPVP